MDEICIFAGTAEGRSLLRYLQKQEVAVTVSVATEYGESLLEQGDRLHVLAGRKKPEELRKLFRSHSFSLVIDATHPYATHITGSLQKVCQEEGLPYLRLKREEASRIPGASYVKDAQEAVTLLSRMEGPILLTTGSKDLPTLSAIENFSTRAYARVLPMESSLVMCKEVGLEPSHIIAMQGPFSTETNVTFLRQTGAKILLTKDGGASGGMQEKVRACAQTGCRLVVIRRPMEEEEGLSFRETVRELYRRFSWTVKPRWTIAGLGPGHPDHMTRALHQALQDCDCVIGSQRLLDAVAFAGKPTFSSFRGAEMKEFAQTHPEYQNLLVLVSGDLGFYSAGEALRQDLAGEEVRTLPGLSSLVYFCSRLGLSYEDLHCMSLHGRDRNPIPDLLRYSRSFCLVGGKDGMHHLLEKMVEAGLGASRVIVGERLSYPEERISRGTAHELLKREFSSLSVCYVESDKADRTLREFGLKDEDFQRTQKKERPVPMTKSEVRAVVLSKLRPCADSVCWDVGAGTGSVSIELARLCPRGRVYGIEQNPRAIALLKENRSRLQVENLELVEGSAPEALANLPAPDRVFIGGSSGKLQEILDRVYSKNPRALVVITAIALETEQALSKLAGQRKEGSLEWVRLTVARSRKLGSMHLMMGQNPVSVVTLEPAEGEGC